MKERLKIGLIAFEFPPATGGMEVVSEALATEMARTDDLVVFTRNGAQPIDGVTMRPVLTGDLSVDVTRLDAPVDVWLALNAGAAALAPRLKQPFVAMCNGTDFLNPWVYPRHRWLQAFQRVPWAWRFQSGIRAAVARRDVYRGLRAAARVVAVSHRTAAEVKQQCGVADKRLSVVTLGVHPRFFDVPDNRDRRGPLRLLTVCRLASANRRKNVDGVLRALATFDKSLDWRYDIVGDGDDRERLEALTRTLGLAGRVRFHGRVSDSALRDRYSEADLFVLVAQASPLDIEGFGLVYIEAAAAGVPSLCSASGGATDAVLDGTTGIVLMESTDEAIVAAVRQFIQQRERFSSDACRDFAKQHSWPACAAQIRLLLLDALAGQDRNSTPIGR